QIQNQTDWAASEHSQIALLFRSKVHVTSRLPLSSPLVPARGSTLAGTLRSSWGRNSPTTHAACRFASARSSKPRTGCRLTSDTRLHLGNAPCPDTPWQFDTFGNTRA